MQVKKAIDIAKDKDLKIQSIERELYYDLINFFKFRTKVVNNLI